MKSLPPSEHFIPSKYLPNYSQSPYGLCYLVTLFNQLSVALAKQKDCNIQLSFWKFVDCFDKYITSKNSDNPISGEKFTTGKKFNLNLQLVDSTQDEYNFTNLISFFPSDLELILQPIYSTANTTLNLGYAYVFKGDLSQSSKKPQLLTPTEFLDPYEGIPKSYHDKWTKVKAIVNNIQNYDISLDQIIERFSFEHYIKTIKEIKIQNNTFDFYTGKFIEFLLQNSRAPFKAICSTFNNIPEARKEETFNSTPNDCFESDNCTANIKLNNKQKDAGFLRDIVGLSSDGIMTQIKNIDTLKIVLSDNKPVMWRARAFITDLLIRINSLFGAIELLIEHNQFNNRNDALSNRLESLKNDSKIIIYQKPEKEKWINLRIQCLDSIFRNRNLKDENNYGIIDISDIKYFYDSTIPELEMYYINNLGEIEEIFVAGNVGHALTIYGYKELSDDKTELYVKNSWEVIGTDDILSDKFRIIVNNDLILDDGRHNGRFGSLSFIKDKYIDFGDVSDNICDCCSNLSSSSSSNDLSSSSSSAGGGSSSSSSIMQSVYACGFGSEIANGQYIYDNSSYNDNPVYINGNSTLYKALPIDTWAISLSGGTSGTVAYFSLNPYSVIDNNWLWSGEDGAEPVGVTQTDPCL